MENISASVITCIPVSHLFKANYFSFSASPVPKVSHSTVNMGSSSCIGCSRLVRVLPELKPRLFQDHLIEIADTSFQNCAAK